MILFAQIFFPIGTISIYFLQTLSSFLPSTLAYNLMSSTELLFPLYINEHTICPYSCSHNTNTLTAGRWFPDPTFSAHSPLQKSKFQEFHAACPSWQNWGRRILQRKALTALLAHFFGGSGIHFFPKWAWAACLSSENPLRGREWNI